MTEPEPHRPTIRRVRRYHFSGFVLDPRTRELWHDGNRSRLQEKPFRMLEQRLRTPREPLTRRQLQRALWSDGTHVDYEVGLHNAARKLREVLGDAADRPRFVETLPRFGYRFLVDVREELEPGPERSRPRRAVKGWNRHWRAGAIAAGLGVVLLTLGLTLPSALEDDARTTREPVAMQAYLRGRYELGRNPPEGLSRAMTAFETAVATDDTFAEAYAALSISITRLALSGKADDCAAIRAEGAARRAIALDATLADGHRSLGEALLFLRWEFDESRASLERAAELDPRSAETQRLLALLASVTGKMSEAIRTKRSVVEADPEKYRVRADLGYHLLAAGQIEQAYESREPQLIFIGSDPEFASLKTEPRYTALLAKIGLPQG